ncbi:hypothetical protein CDAR_603971 [Caerostris darwini]|uniref:Uncharacterized protein n=1 Tax=Caerostris darwini TaxID=1538125 RepID=A0AAV4S1C5_9ARAC|nr:hypothetical protein CDAR_603971 [Caerostris darwini]
MKYFLLLIVIAVGDCLSEQYSHQTDDDGKGDLPPDSMLVKRLKGDLHEHEDADDYYEQNESDMGSGDVFEDFELADYADVHDDDEDDDDDHVDYVEEAEPAYYMGDVYDQWIDYDDDYHDDDRYVYPGDHSLVLEKLRKLMGKKKEVTTKLKIHNYTYNYAKKESHLEKDPKGKYQNFEKVLRSTYPENEWKSKKPIQLFYISFSTRSPGLFNGKDENKFIFNNGTEKHVIVPTTDETTKNQNASLIIQGQKKFSVQFNLGSNYSHTQHDSDSQIIFFDPELRIGYDFLEYKILAFIKPKELAFLKSKSIKEAFSKVMNSSENANKFALIVKHQPNMNYSVEEISMDDDIFVEFEPFIRETQKNTVKVDFNRAIIATFKDHLSDLEEDNKLGLSYRRQPHRLENQKYRPKHKYDNEHEIKNNATEAMENLFYKALEILTESVQKVPKDTTFNDIREFIMGNLKQLFKEHRKLVGNNDTFHEHRQHFAVWATT